MKDATLTKKRGRKPVAQSVLGMSIGNSGNGPEVSLSIVNRDTAQAYYLKFALSDFDELAAFIAKNRATYEPQPYRLGDTDYVRIQHDAMQPGSGTEVTEAEYNEMLEVLPPIYCPKGGWLVSECVTHNVQGPVYAQYIKRDGRYYAKYVTRGLPETYMTL